MQSLNKGVLQSPLKYIDKLFELDYKDQDLVRIKSQILISQGKPDPAIEFLQGELDFQKIDKNKLELYSILVFAFDRALRPDDSERLLESLEKEYPDNPVVLYAKVKHLHLIGEYEESIQLSLDAEEKAAGKIKVLLKLERADVLFEKKDKESFKEAAETYGELCNKNYDDFLLRRYVLCLFNSQQYAECLRVCKKIQKDGPINLYTKLEGEIYYNTQNFIPAKESFKWLSKREPNHVDNFIKYAVCLYRLNSPQKAYQVVRRVANKVEGSANDLLNIAFTFAQIGKTKEAAEYSNKAIKVGSDDVNINMGYIVLWIRHIQNIDGIPEEHINTFQDTLHSFNEKFPEQEDFIELIETPADDIELLKKEILERLPSKEWREQLHELFQEKKYPVELLSKLTGRDIYTIWKSIINHPNYGLFSNSGNPSNLRDEIRAIGRTNSILLGPVALFTINKIELVDHLLGQFEKIYVPQITLDIFRNIVETEKMSIKNGGMTGYL